MASRCLAVIKHFLAMGLAGGIGTWSQSRRGESSIHHCLPRISQVSVGSNFFLPYRAVATHSIVSVLPKSIGPKDKEDLRTQPEELHWKAMCPWLCVCPKGLLFS